MFSTEYYCLVASLREWTLDSDTKGFDVREILDEIFEELTDKDRKAVELLYSAASQGWHSNSLLALPTAIIQRGQTHGIVVLFPDVI